MNDMRSTIEYMQWPPVLTGAPAALAALTRQLAQTEWSSYEAVRRGQYAQLAQLASHSHRHSPYFRARLERAHLAPSDLGMPQGLDQLPPFSWRDLKQAGGDFFCGDVPPSHLPVQEMRCTAEEAFVLRKTAVSAMFEKAAVLRDHAWHRRDARQPLMVIRPQIDKPATLQDWGPPVSSLYQSGPVRALPVSTAIAEQWRELLDFGPTCLLTTPANLQALVEHGERHALKAPGIRHLWSIAEMTPLPLRERAERFFAARVEDHYVRPEFGVVAVQCPERRSLHIVSEHLLVEIAADNGRRLPSGQRGRLLITALHNLASPLIRYDTGIRAQIGHACSCGRPLPTLG